MVDKFIAGQQPIGPLRPRPTAERPAVAGKSVAPDVSFAEVLKRQTQIPKLRFSAHAEQRMKDRNIRLSEAELAQLEEAVARAKAKGARESLVMMSRAAFVVSIRNQMVITAVDQESMKQNVFTNIDSAVIV